MLGGKRKHGKGEEFISLQEEGATGQRRAPLQELASSEGSANLPLPLQALPIIICACGVIGISRCPTSSGKERIYSLVFEEMTPKIAWREW